MLAKPFLEVRLFRPTFGMTEARSHDSILQHQAGTGGKPHIRRASLAAYTLHRCDAADGVGKRIPLAPSNVIAACGGIPLHPGIDPIAHVEMVRRAHQVTVS